MFYVKCGSESIMYTGDYNMTPDRHLGAAWVDKCRPDLLITESTYATTIRDSKRFFAVKFLLVHCCSSALYRGPNNNRFKSSHRYTIFL